MKKIKQYLLSLAALIMLFAPVATAAPLTQFGAACSGGRFLTFPAWYKGLDCDAKNVPQFTKLGDVWKIGLNVVEMLIIAAGYIAVGMIIWAGVKYIKSRGDPAKIVEAKTTITQAVVGLGIALASVAIVEYVSGVV